MGAANEKKAAATLLQQKKAALGIAEIRSFAAARLSRIGHLTAIDAVNSANNVDAARERRAYNQRARELWYTNESGWGQHRLPRFFL